MATTSTPSVEAASREYIAAMNGQYAEDRVLEREIIRLQEVKEDYLHHKNEAILKANKQMMDARQATMSARANILKASAGGVYAADINAAQRDLDSLRDAEVKLADGFSAQASSRLLSLRGEAASLNPGSADEQNRYVWKAIVDRMDPGDSTLPFVLDAARRTIGDPSTMLDTDYKFKYDELKKAADNTLAMRNVVETSLRGSLGTGDATTKMKEILGLLGPDPAAPQVDEIDIGNFSDKFLANQDRLEKLYENRLDGSVSRGGAGASTASAPAPNWFTGQTGLSSDQLAELMARPAFQEWASDHGFVVGSGTKNEDGTWTYTPGKDDIRAIRYSIDQSEGKHTPDRSRHSFAPSDLSSIRVSKPGAAGLVHADGQYRTFAMPDGTEHYVPADLAHVFDEPFDGFKGYHLPRKAAVALTAGPVEFAFKGDAAYAKKADGSVVRITATGIEDVSAPPEGLDFAPMVARSTGKPITIEQAIDPAFVDDWDPAPKVERTPVTVAAEGAAGAIGKDAGTPAPSEDRPTMVPTTVAPSGDTVMITGLHVPRNPRDPVDSVRRYYGGSVHLFTPGPDGTYVEVDRKPDGRFDYEGAIIEPQEKARVERRRREAYDAAMETHRKKVLESGDETLPEKGEMPTKAADAVAKAEVAVELPEASPVSTTSTVSPEFSPTPVDNETKEDVTARVTANAAEHAERLGGEQQATVKPDAAPRIAKTPTHDRIREFAERAVRDRRSTEEKANPHTIPAVKATPIKDLPRPPHGPTKIETATPARLDDVVIPAVTPALPTKDREDTTRLGAATVRGDIPLPKVAAAPAKVAVAPSPTAPVSIGAGTVVAKPRPEPANATVAMTPITAPTAKTGEPMKVTPKPVVPATTTFEKPQDEPLTGAESARRNTVMTEAAKGASKAITSEAVRIAAEKAFRNKNAAVATTK